MSNYRRVLAVDPGREKCGVAVVDREHGVMEQAIVGANQLPVTAAKWAQRHSCRLLIVGNRTASEQIAQSLASLVTEGIIEAIGTVEEHRSTEQARLRYWQANPPDGWRRLIPCGLLIPPCAIDDFAAIILAERYFAQNVKKI